MPDHRGRAEADRPPRVLKPPADVDVVAGGAERRVEAADRCKRRAPERHVAARDVLGLACRRAGRGSGPPGAWRDASATGASSAGAMFGPPIAAWARGQERRGEVAEPVRIGVGVVVEVGDDVARRRRCQPVLRAHREARVRPVEMSRTSYSRGDRGRPVGRAVVDDDHLEVRDSPAARRPRGSPDRPRAVVGADDHRDARPVDVGRERDGVEGARRRPPARASATGPRRSGRTPSRRPGIRRGTTRRSTRRRRRPRNPSRTRCGSASRAPPPAGPRRCASRPARPRSSTAGGRRRCSGAARGRPPACSRDSR